MTEELFSAPVLQFAVLREADGSIAWRGDYMGKKVKAAVPVDQAARCVILLDPDAGAEKSFNNLFCIERSGSIAWSAELPQTHDAFIDVRMEPDGLHASSWSGFSLRLDPSTGRIIDRAFAK